MRLNLHAGLTSLDPAFASNQSNVWMCQQLFSTLVGVDSSGALVPDAARRWARSADGLSYRFELRTDLYFHPHPIFGLSRTRRLTARDVSYTLHRLCQPETGSPGLWILNGKLRGVAAYRTGQADTLAGVAVVNDSTLVLHLEQPFPPFLQLLSMPYAGIVPQEVVAHYGKDFRQHPIGTGPFRFYRWEEGRLLVLHRNPHYYQRGLPRLDAVAVHFIPSKLGAFNAFLEGRIDLIDALDPSYQDELLTATGQLRPRYRPLTFYAGPQLSTEYLGIRLDPTSRHPLQDVRVRQALSLGIDRAGLCRYLLHGTALPAAQGLVPPGMPGYAGPPAQASGYDPARAQALLAAAGYPGGTGLPVLQLYTNPGYAHVAQYLQKNLAALGIRLQLALEEGSTLRERIRKGEALLWRASWVADYADPENFLSLLYSPNHPPQGSATTRYRSPAADAAYEAALRAPDSLRMRYYRQMEEQMLQDVPLIPLYYYKTFRLAQPWVQGMPTQAMNLYFPLKYTALRPRPVAAGAAAGR
ncbi:MAG: ABC transporter substrate-binding protein [Sphingobacteriia bacterium]